jgi:hypothetical protein
VVVVDISRRMWISLVSDGFACRRMEIVALVDISKSVRCGFHDGGVVVDI